MELLETIWVILSIYLGIGVVLGVLVVIGMIYDVRQGRKGMEFLPAMIFVALVIIAWPLIIAEG